MKTKTHTADYYRLILAVQPHALKRLDTFAKIMGCNRGQEIPNNSGPAGHWYYVITGAVRRCVVRADGRRQIVDLMLPQDFFLVSDSQSEATIEVIAEETVLQAIRASGLNYWRNATLSSHGSSGRSHSSP
jgi:CRP/FNR family nitrogen fixation transcriptional regulator